MNSTPKVHPVACTDDGLAIIGQTRHGIMGIRYAAEIPGAPAGGTPAPQAVPPVTPAGGMPKAPATPAAPAPGAPAAPLPTPEAVKTPETGAQPPATDLPAINKTTGKPYTPAETQAYIKTINDDAKAQRTAAAEAKAALTAAEERNAAILKAAGFNPDGTPYTELKPEEISAAKAASDKRADALIRENLLLRVAGSLEADVEKLADSRTFETKLSELQNPDKESVETLVKDWLENHPDHKRIPAAASSGGVAHAGGVPTTQRKTLTEALDAKFKGQATAPRK